MQQNCIAVTGGGTGGHIYPAISVAEALMGRGDLEICYLGSRGGMEEKIVSQMGYCFIPVSAAGVMNKSVRKQLKALHQAFIGIGEARSILKQKQPKLIFATGGYVSLPVIVAGWTLGIPVVLHEQNAFPGLVNRLGSLFSKNICVTFVESKAHFWKKKGIIHTGLPIRGAFHRQAEGSSKKDKDGITILVSGGSQGAKPINDAVLAASADLISDGYRMILLTGEKNYLIVEEQLKERFSGTIPTQIKLLSFSDDMPKLMHQADLVISRAGASFLAEMNAVGLTGILIPFPHAASDHQRFNAQAEQEAGAALLLEEKELSAEKLINTIKTFNKETIERMSASSQSYAQINAVDRIMEVLAPYL
ncbi:undecaprenyldiphospho-muramoylpentapeptide beta-N-acetylglucosaminyltransferase [Clostridia bacterium]|nr:undecaprenyldiphospho-muramoylpentapeptide beta-N-acetylglucosaminyltransferase [Clostridia bacterium]